MLLPPLLLPVVIISRRMCISPPLVMMIRLRWMDEQATKLATSIHSHPFAHFSNEVLVGSGFLAFFASIVLTNIHQTKQIRLGCCWAWENCTSHLLDSKGGKITEHMWWQ